MLFNYLFLFMIGSILGFFLELVYRKIVNKKWIKPGVFNGLYLPLYGLGLVIVYFVYSLSINVVFKIILSVTLLTFIELLCGLIFIKYFKIALWDYSNNHFNYEGLICLKFSIYWSVISCIFIFLIFPYINFNLFNIQYVIYFMYFFYMILISDVLYTLTVLLLNKYC